MVRLQGYGCSARPGEAQLPSKAILVAIPEGSSVDLEVLRSDTTQVSCQKVFPVPRLSVREEQNHAYSEIEEYVTNPNFYRSRLYYPSAIAEVRSYAYLRDLRVAQILLSPIQYSPAKHRMIVHKNIWLRIRLHGGSFPQDNYGCGSPDGKGDPYAMIFRNLVVNYHPALRCERPPLVPSSSPRAIENDLGAESFKVAITRDGLYEIGYSDLLKVGAVPSAIDPRTVKLFNLGDEIPLFITGNHDNAFDSTDCVVFWGSASKSAYSDTNMYWLSWNSGNGKRMRDRDLSLRGGYPLAASYPWTHHFEENHIYYATVYEGEGKDHWLWGLLVGPCSRQYSLDTPGVVTGSYDAQLTLRFLGKTDAGHSVQVMINGEMIGSVSWSGMSEYEATLSFPCSVLRADGNVLEVDIPQSSLDQSYLNWFEVHYRRGFEASNNTLQFSDDSPGGNQFRITSFTDSVVDVFCLSDRHDVEHGVGYSVIREDAGYDLIMADSTENGEYLAITNDHIEHPARIVRDRPSDLHSPLQGADYIIISHEKFLTSITPLANFRRSQGLRVAVVDVNDIYDEFNYGNADPAAIKAFLSFCYGNWCKPAPTFVLLVGDASTDYRHSDPTFNVNYVPTHLFISQADYFETASDDWFVQIAGEDMLPDMLVGRFPAQTTKDAEAMVSKVIEYETQAAGTPSSRKIVLVSDNSDIGGDFEGICNRFADNYIIPAGFDPTKLYVSQYGSNCRDYIVRAIDHGAVLCNYVGHGSTDIWGAENIFNSSDISGLSNAGKYPFVFTCACLNGYFPHVEDDYCIAEEFLRASQKGAVACLSHSGMEYSYCSEIMGNGLYDALLTRNDYIVGSAACEAKVSYLGQLPDLSDQAAMLTLLGDPALEIGFPGRPDLLMGSVQFQPPCPHEHQKDTIVATVYNSGRADTRDIGLRFIVSNSSGITVAELRTVVPILAAGNHAFATAVYDSVPEPGRYLISAYVDPDGEIPESCEWNNGTIDTLIVCAEEVPEDTIPPVVKLYIDDKNLGDGFRNGDFAPTSLRIKAVVTDSTSGINTADVCLYLNGERQYGLTIEPDDQDARRVRLSYEPGHLSDGEYTIQLIVPDRSAIRNVQTVTALFRVESRLTIERVSNFPNPFNGPTRFAFSLSQRPDLVSMSIFDARGRLVATMESRNCTQNRNTLCWDARGRHGEQIPSGLYFYRIRAWGESGDCEGKGKMVILR
jgi:hypothetical protein